MYVTDIEGNDGSKAAIFRFHHVDIFEGISLTETKIWFYSNHLASFPDITHIKVNNGLKLTIFNLIELRFFHP